MTKKIRRIAGFTLLEIMIVTFVIGLLASIALPSFAHARTQSRRSSCLNNLRLIEASKELYALYNNVGSETSPASDDLEPYMKNQSFPSCPGGGTYTIDFIGTSPSCNLSSAPQLHVVS